MIIYSYTIYSYTLYRNAIYIEIKYDDIYRNTFWRFTMNKIQKYSPLTEATYYILVSLKNPLHGYGIIKKVEEMSNGRVRLAAGTLYGAINNLLKNNLIILIGEDQENKRRKLYQITDMGCDLINYEIKRLQEMVTNGMKEMGGGS